MLKFSSRFQNTEIKCDERDCGFAEEFYGKFDECVAEAKSGGWEFTKSDTQICPGCVQFNKNNLERYGKN